MSIQTLQSLQKQLDSKLKREGVQILYRLFNEFLRHSYSQMEED